ncbi:MAG: patatin family protein [Lachnospiraceae bacterium]|nr:patatin family protein [Lachnospiraceae bacterium]MBQ1415344.1 patatin family protein [Lachnospiraceae bacterium]MBQ9464002.1 patatin family protein [Lachnospiraceae bacterium]MBR0106224.1 patatin family protein [Lachnospiraceae bacterium]MBR0401918.1 patatin family protein [Lachnospiraceae bacterium]
MTKIGLVAEGGGMKCAYGAGVLDSFLDHGITFDYYIGVSAGAANIASFLGGQRDRNRRYYVEHISDPLYFGLRAYAKTRNMFNLQHIYGDMTNEGGVDPLDFDTFSAAPGEYEVCAADALTGRPAYFPKESMRRNDYRHIMASCALPALCRPIFIGGRPYFDGGTVDAVPTKRAMERGCDKLVVILSKPRAFVKQPEGHRRLYAFLCRKYPEIVKALDRRHLMYRECQEHFFGLEREGRAFLYTLESDLKMSTYTMDAQVNQRLYDLGFSDAERRLPELLEFLGK